MLLVRPHITCSGHGNQALGLATRVTRKRATAGQFTRGAAPDAIATREGGTRQGYRTEVIAAVPGRTASNAALVTPIWSAMRGSGRGASTGEPE